MENIDLRCSINHARLLCWSLLEIRQWDNTAVLCHFCDLVKLQLQQLRRTNRRIIRPTWLKITSCTSRRPPSFPSPVWLQREYFPTARCRCCCFSTSTSLMHKTHADFLTSSAARRLLRRMCSRVSSVSLRRQQRSCARSSVFVPASICSSSSSGVRFSATHSCSWHRERENERCCRGGGGSGWMTEDRSGGAFDWSKFQQIAGQLASLRFYKCTARVIIPIKRTA